MKKTLKILGISAVLLALLAVALLVFLVGGKKIKDGTYHIVGNSQYPNAVIVVKNGEIQFRNIDLNDLYQEKELEVYHKLVANGSVYEFTEQELNDLSNLNGYFADRFYPIDYSKANKNGTFKYFYYCLPGGNFGLVVHYDAFHKTIR